MKHDNMRKVLAIINQCDPLTIEKEDKDLTIAAIGTIITALRKFHLVTTEISALYAILKYSTWDNGYFCICARKICSALWPVVDSYAVIADAFNI